MTPADAPVSRAAAPSRESRWGWLRSRPALWAGLLLVHAWLSVVSLVGDDHPLGDVSLVYLQWMRQGFETQSWVGIDSAWVYPIVAIVPMLVAWLFGPDNYALTWLALVSTLDAVAFGFLIGWSGRARNRAAAWWWIGFLAFLGPIALARLDSVTVPLCIIGVVLVSRRPMFAAVVLTIATWIKVWPGAILVALAIAVRARWRILTAALASSAVVILVALALGGGGTVFSFAFEQSDRGLQIEAPVSALWLWQAAVGARHARVYYDTGMLTFQVTGDGASSVAALMTPLLACAAMAVALFAVYLVRHRTGESAGLLPILVLSLVAVLIAFNKVGSPQFMSWLAVPVILGLVTHGAGLGVSFRAPAVLTLVMGGLTQLIYPYLYDELLALNPALLVLLTTRNVLVFVLLVWAVVSMARWGTPRTVTDLRGDGALDVGAPR